MADPAGLPSRLRGARRIGLRVEHRLLSGLRQALGVDRRGPVASVAVCDADRPRVHDIDDHIVRNVLADGAARARALADPIGVFARTAQELFCTRPEEAFGIREVKVAEDTATMLYFVLIARHEPGPSATADSAT